MGYSYPLDFSQVLFRFIFAVFCAILSLMANLIGSALRKARREANLKQQDLASLLGVSPAFVNQIETGQRHLPLKHYAALPLPIRDAVIDAAKGDLRDRIAWLDQIGRE
jgi:DNA-binding XRE family transcriptional regulator